MKIYEIIKNSIEQEIKDECRKFREGIEAEFTVGGISEFQRITMISTINRLEKLIMGRL